MQLITRWGKAVQPDRVLPEYPRPNLVRKSYLSLNGEWEYGITPEQAAPCFQGTILVPFSPETLLSGVNRIVHPGEALHYRRTFTLPPDFRKERVLLHFGGVDQECSVFLNGRELGHHKGGYLPFTFDLSSFLQDSENTLSLRVIDRTECAPHARGKQKLTRDGKYHWLFYPPQSGIWKTVWLESVPDPYITEVRFTPVLDEGAVRILVTSSSASSPGQQVQVKIRSPLGLCQEAYGAAGEEFIVSLDQICPWSPEDPLLYTVDLHMGTDEVSSYFGLRKLSTGTDSNGIRRFYLNNSPFFFNGVLDQGYWPESLMTPPSDEALIYDIQKLKDLGYNTIRKHVKTEPERFYYHCDRLGMMVWQDMPNGGGEYDMTFVTDLPNDSDDFCRSIRDDPEHYHLFARSDEQGRSQYYADLRQMIRELYNFPCIAVWVLFNEGWGQFDAAKATALVRNLDPTRLINEACGWFDQGGGDMHSIHNYNSRLTVSPPATRVLALTEFGGYAYRWRDTSPARNSSAIRYSAPGKNLRNTTSGCGKRMSSPTWSTACAPPSIPRPATLKRKSTEL